MASKKTRSLDEIKKLASEMFLFDSFDDYNEKDIVDLLKVASDLYHNEQESFLSDDQYDALTRYAELSFGVDPTLHTGAEVRGGSNIKLPYPLGSLDQLYEGEIDTWFKNNKLDREDKLVVTEKLDGNSGLAMFDGENGKLRISYSRGDGVEGADTTRHVRRFLSLPSHTIQPLHIRGEIILSKTSFEFLKTRVMSRSGKPYKNARNMVTGLMNAESNDPLVYEHLRFIAYDILNVELSKNKQLELLKQLGFDTPQYLQLHIFEVTDETLTQDLNDIRRTSEYEIDGLVIDLQDIETRKRLNPTRDTLNPAYAFKYKVADASNLAEAEVISVEWNVSKHGYLKPRVNIKPVELVGVTVQFATGFNARFINDNKIGPGAIIRITRSGDVIPFITGVITSAAESQMPSGDWKWNETEVDAVLTTTEGNEEVAIQQTLDFFTSIDAPNLKEGTIREAFAVSKYENSSMALVDIIMKDEDSWKALVGANGSKIYAGLKDKLSNIAFYELLGATSYFGRGVGVRKWKKLVNGLELKTIPDLFNLTVGNIVTVDGFDEKTAKKIVAGVQSFIQFYACVTDYVNFTIPEKVSGGEFTGKGFVFTGFRSKELEASIEAQGGVIQSGVSKKTSYVVAANPNENSTKLKKARDMGIIVIGQDELKDLLNE